MSILISIKPEYVRHIFSERKKFEFRKKVAGNFRHKRIYIYSSSPTKMIVGYFTSTQIIQDSPDKLWKRCKDWAGIEKKDFFEYFADRDIGFALEISNLKRFKTPIDPRERFPSFTPPQSYYYIDQDLESRLSV